MIDIKDLLLKGFDFRAKEHSENEKDKQGYYRAGSVGCVTEANAIIGVCHRKSLARSLGIEAPTPHYQRILFKAGEFNEDVWKHLLGPVWSGRLLSHAECKIEYKINDDVIVIGHPDIVLADDTGKPLLGLELKGIFGYTTAASVHYDNRPKNENLIQAAMYSMALNIPYALCYTSASWISTKYYHKKQYGDDHILPFNKVYYLEWRDDRLYYRPEDQAAAIKTVITKSGIEDYYKLLHEMKTTKQLGPRPTTIYADGTEARWGACGLCEFAPICDKHENNFDTWLKELKNEFGK